MEEGIKFNKVDFSQFLSGGGKMGELIRSKDWSATTMGEPETWPQSLKTAVSTCMNAPIPVSIFWGQELVMLCNDLFMKLIGRQHWDLLGPIRNESLPETWTFLRPLIKAVIQDGKAISLENQRGLINHNSYGNGFTFSLSPVYGESGNAEGVFCIAAEIASTREVIENKDLLPSVFDSAPNGIAVLQTIYDEKGKIEDFAIMRFNAHTLNWIGDIDYKGKRYSDVFPMVKRTGILEKFKQVAETGITVNFERWYAGEGMKHWFRFTAVKQGELLVVTTEDITEWKKAEEALNAALQTSQQQQRLYNSVTNNTPDLVYVFDRNYRFTYANKALLSMWGKTSEDAIGKGLRENGYEEWHAQMHEREIDEVIATKRSIRGTVSFPHAELGKRIYDYIFSPVFNEKGDVEAIAGTTRDITDIKQNEDAIKESETQLAFAIDAANLGVWDYNPITNKFKANSRMRSWFGFEQDEEFDLSLGIAAMEESDRQRVAEAIQKASTWGGGDYDIEYTIIHPQTGQKRIVRAKGKATFNDEKIAYRFNGTLQDVTEHALARKQIEESEQRFQNLIREATVGIIVLTGVEMKVEIVNEAYSKLIQRTTEELLGKELFKIIPESEEYFRPIIDGVRQSGEELYLYGTPYFVWVEDQKKEGFLNLVYQPYKESDGTVSGVMILCQDVTAQIQAQQKLEESESRFRLLSNEMPQLVWTGDANGHLVYFNDAVYKYSGLSKNDIAKEGWIQIVHPEEQEENIRKWQQSIATGENFIFEHRFKRADGEYRWQLSRAIPQRDARGVIQQWIGSSTDIHDQKNVEEQLESLVAERTKELQRSNEDLQQFAHVASHDLKEPVRKIKTYLGRLVTEYGTSLPPRGKEFVKKMESATSRIYNMIDGVLLYSSVDALKGSVQKVSLKQIMEDVLVDLEITIEQKGAQINYGSLPDLKGVQVLLYQLFYNLINNALKFSNAGVKPIIKIITDTINEDDIENANFLPMEDYVSIFIEDNGIGFEQFYAEEIFKTFKRLNSKDNFEGTGLGLALCKKIVERHGGVISATSKPGKGSTFKIILPYYK